MSLPKEVTPLFSSHVYPPPSLRSASLPALSILLQSYLEEQCRGRLQGYIWQREAPRVIVGSSEEGKDSDCLLVTMRHGGSVEDEWLAVHLLLLATCDARFTEEALLNSLQGGQTGSSMQQGGLVVDALDEDGQFLLIEAADHLPAWLQPDNADGRLWMYGGRFHLIPPEMHPGDLDSSESAESQLDSSPSRSLKSHTGVSLVRSSQYDTTAPPAFEQAIIRQRLPTHPDPSWAVDNQHCTLAYLSKKAAVALHQQPQLISHAAEAFDGREGPSDAKRLREMRVFGPSTASDVQSNGDANAASKTRGEDVLLVKVKVPRRMYANLLTQRYFPPKAFGDNWRAAVSAYWESLETLSRGETNGSTDLVDSNGRRHDLGVKISCGLELAYANVRERLRNQQVDLFTNDDALRASPAYGPFIKALASLGYFGSELRDSQAWKAKEKHALGLLRKLEPVQSQRDGEHVSDSLQQLDEIGGAKGASLVLPPHLDRNTPAQALTLEEDPDSFLYDTPEQLKASVKSQDGLAAGGEVEEETEEEKAAMGQVNAFAEKLQSFVDGKGDITGALFEDEEMASDVESDEEEGESKTRRLEDMTQAERQEAMKGLIPEVPAAEWGAKASSAANLPMEEDMSSANGNGRREADIAAAGFSRHVQYDGASDSEESVDDDILRAGDTDEDRRSRAKWLGMEKELEDDERQRQMAMEEGDDEAVGLHGGPEGEEGIDFGQDELLSFIEFTRKELGLTEAQYEDILRKRRERGAYVPGPTITRAEDAKDKKVSFSVPHEQQQSGVTLDDADDGHQHKSSKQLQAERREEQARSLRNERTTTEEKEIARQRAQRALEQVEQDAQLRNKASTTNGAATVSTEKDPFEELMRAMDGELAKYRASTSSTRVSDTTANVRNTADEEDDEDQMSEDEILSAEDAELLDKMLHNGPPASLRALLQKQHATGSSSLSSVEEEVMKSMLASYQAQLGGSGPVGALAGRFGLGPLPPDADRS